MMCSVGAMARRVSRIRNKWLCPYSSYESQDAREPVYTRPTLAYAVRRGDPELVGPASLTPRETKHLSDLDKMHIFRMQMPITLSYRGGGEAAAGVIRRALGEALVHYYPLAGRLREIEGGELLVDCTGEGVLFVQADADVQLADLEAAGAGPFPCWDQLLFVKDASTSLLLNSPLLLIQVTRLLCGGFILTIQFSHTICDGIGIAQFLNAVGELARGLPSITVTPVWSRGLLTACLARRPRPELDVLPPPAQPADMVTRYFKLSASDIAKMKKSLRATSFEAITAFVWRARTAALELPPGEVARLAVSVNTRGKLSLPAGYYGNAVVSSTALVDSEALYRGTLGDAVALVRLAKAAATRECVRSIVDQVALVGQRTWIPLEWFVISDARHLGLAGVDLGWGKPVFAGPAEPLIDGVSYIIPVNLTGAVCVRVVLPRGAMQRFAARLETSLQA